MKNISSKTFSYINIAMHSNYFIFSSHFTIILYLVTWLLSILTHLFLTNRLPEENKTLIHVTYQGLLKLTSVANQTEAMSGLFDSDFHIIMDIS